MYPMIFQVHEGLPVPLLVRDRDGRLREPDGVMWFSAEQAAAATGRPVEQVRDLWVMVWSDALRGGEDEPLFTPDGDPADPASGGAATTAGGTPAAPRDRPGELDTLRRVVFGHLGQEDFDRVVDVARRRRLNLWAGQVWAETRWNAQRKRNDVLIKLTIEGLRAVAHRTGQYAGNGRVEFDYVDGRDPPFRAQATVFRLVDGGRQPFVGEAYWDEYAPAEIKGTLWERMPRAMLGKCAKAAALREAFAEECGGLYVEEELARSAGASGRASGGSADRGDAVASRGDAVDADRPQTQMAFHLRLIDYGLGSPAARNHLVERMRQRFPGLVERDAPEFYRRALDCLRREPAKWGAVVPGSGNGGGPAEPGVGG